MRAVKPAPTTVRPDLIDETLIGSRQVKVGDRVRIIPEGHRGFDARVTAISDLGEITVYGGTAGRASTRTFRCDHVKVAKPRKGDLK